MLLVRQARHQASASFSGLKPSEYPIDWNLPASHPRIQLWQVDLVTHDTPKRLSFLKHYLFLLHTAGLMKLPPCLSELVRRILDFRLGLSHQARLMARCAQVRNTALVWEGPRKQVQVLFRHDTWRNFVAAARIVHGESAKRTGVFYLEPAGDASRTRNVTARQN